jgi:hypothetical protein
MSDKARSPSRTVVLLADDEPFPVVFEMGAMAIDVPARSHIRLVVSGPEDAKLTVGYGRNGVSLFRDLELEVQVYDAAGELLEIVGFG